MQKFQNDLRKVGLSDKEAAVYLALLSLNSGTVQKIARKAGVARATTYLVLESLLDMGLVSKFEEDATTVFVVESPASLENLVQKEERAASQSRAALQEFLPKLQASMQRLDDRPVARYFDGLEGLRAIRSDMTRTAKAGDVWYQFSPIDYMVDVFDQEGQEDDAYYVRQRKAKGIYSKAITATKSAKRRAFLEKTREPKWAERKFVSPQDFSSSSGFTVYHDKVVITSFGDKMGGVVIDSESVATMMKEVFLLAWNTID